ncbi:MAG: hypothetical protein AB7U85_07595 [Alphaproteobacteria bacterium]
MLIQEKNYEVLQNPEGELLFSIKSRNKAPSSPRMLYAGGKHAVLYRSEEESLLLDFLPTLAQTTIKNLKQVLIVEFDKEELVREYDAPVQHLSKLPINEEHI